MDEEQKGRLKRYAKNASRFLWGLPRLKQVDAYNWLRQEGYGPYEGSLTVYKGSYGHVTNQLLQNPGIEEVIKKLVVPRVKQLFSEEAIEFFRGCWNTGTLPGMSSLGTYNIKDKDAYPFLEVNSQFNYVERWGEFAGVWFEEIEKLQEQ